MTWWWEEGTCEYHVTISCTKWVRYWDQQKWRCKVGHLFYFHLWFQLSPPHLTIVVGHALRWVVSLPPLAYFPLILFHIFVHWLIRDCILLILLSPSPLYAQVQLQTLYCTFQSIDSHHVTSSRISLRDVTMIFLKTYLTMQIRSYAYRCTGFSQGIWLVISNDDAGGDDDGKNPSDLSWI